ncbi:MAG: AfsR/SARP family transcriptional regulator [Candidatus Xenobia bacterium]
MERLHALQDVDGAAGSLDAVLDLFRGPLLAGDEVDWIVTYRRALARRMGRAFTRAAKLYVRAGRLPEAVRRFEELLGRFPRHQTTAVRLIELLLRMREVDRANAVAKRIMRKLKKAGVDPSDRLTRVIARISFVKE